MSERFVQRRIVEIVGLVLGICVCACSPMEPTDPGPGGPSTQTFSLSGRVVETFDNAVVPIPSTRIVIPTIGTRESDRNGYYGFSGLPAGNYSVEFISPHHEALTRTVRVERDTVLDVELTKPLPYTLSGVVYELTDAGPVPVTGVHVENSNLHDVALTDEKGFYRVTVYRGETYLYVAKAGYRNASRSLVIDGNTELDLQLHRQ